MDRGAVYIGSQADAGSAVEVGKRVNRRKAIDLSVMRLGRKGESPAAVIIFMMEGYRLYRYRDNRQPPILFFWED
jgi:hypothetical protein